MKKLKLFLIITMTSIYSMHIQSSEQNTVKTVPSALFPFISSNDFIETNKNSVSDYPGFVQNLLLKKGFSNKTVKKLKHDLSKKPLSISEINSNRLNKLLIKAILENNTEICAILCCLPTDPTTIFNRTTGEKIQDLITDTTDLKIKDLILQKLESINFYEAAWDN